jgi:hypothetical protein
VVDIPDAYLAATATPAQRDQVIQHVMLTNKVDQAMKDLIDVQERVGSGKIIPGKEKSAYETAYQAAIGAFTDIAHSGVLNAGEYPRYAQRLPSTFEPKDELMDVYNKYLGNGGEENTSLSRLRGVQKELRSIGSAGLQGYGVHPDYEGTGAQPTPSVSKRVSDTPDTRSAPAAGDRLPITSGKPPMVEDKATKVRIKYPDGVVEEEQLSPKQIRDLLKVAPRGTEVLE